MQRVMWGVNFAHFQIEWLMGKCHSFGFSGRSEVARLKVCWNVATRDAMRLGAWDLMLNFNFIARDNPEIEAF
jgi:hypothetical protein